MYIMLASLLNELDALGTQTVVDLTFPGDCTLSSDGLHTQTVQRSSQAVFQDPVPPSAVALFD
jgi:hypothetical protein